MSGTSPLNPNKARPPPVTIDKRRSLTGPSDSGLQTPRTLTRTLTPQSPISPGFLNQAPYTDAPPSTELLLPPSRDRYRAHYEPSVSSRRSSISSFDSNGDIRYGPYAMNDPFADSRAGSRCGSPENDHDSDEEMNSETITYSQRFDVTPRDGIMLYRDQPEEDDDMHDPGKDDGLKGDCDIWTKRGVINVGALVIFMCVLLTLLVAYPIMIFMDHYHADTMIQKRSLNPTGSAVDIPPSLHTIVPDTVWTEAARPKKEEEQVGGTILGHDSDHAPHKDHSGLKRSAHSHTRRRKRRAAAAEDKKSSKEGITGKAAPAGST